MAAIPKIVRSIMRGLAAWMIMALVLSVTDNFGGLITRENELSVLTFSAALGALSCYI